MTGPATQQAQEYRKPTDEEWKHIIHHHIGIQISTTDGAATVSIVGECDDPKCPTHVPSCKYCKRPPC
jgi:hypothetical protein